MPVTQIIQAVAQGAGNSTPPALTENWFQYTSDDPSHGYAGADNWWQSSFNSGGAFRYSALSNPAPTWNSYVYPDTSTGHTLDFSGSEYLVGPDLVFDTAWSSNTITIDFWFYPTANGVQLLGEHDNQNLNTGYRYSMLEIDSGGSVHAKFWDGTPIVSVNEVDLNKWNHIWFTEDSQGGHSFELNGVPTNGNPTYTRTKPGTAEIFAIGDSCITNMGNTGRFQGKIGLLTISDYVASSTYSTYRDKYRPAFVDTGIGLGTSWTVEVVADLHPTTFWATMWGNENYNSGTGHFAYLTSTTTLNVGSPAGTDTYNLADDVSVKSYWAFVHTDGSGINVYRNGTLLTKSSPGYVQANPANNTLLIGARHTNSGTGSTDTCDGNYHYTNITSTPLDASNIASNYNTLKNTYGLP